MCTSNIQIRMEIAKLATNRDALQARIYELKKQLERRPLWIYEEEVNKPHDRIGNCNIDCIRTIMSKLYQGERLLFTHNYFGSYTVYINPQKNKICVNPYESTRNYINEVNIFSFILWHPGDWYLLPNNSKCYEKHIRETNEYGRIDD